jgi:hypothetical protein
MYSYEYIKTESKKMREDFGISLPSKSSQAGLALVFMYNEKRPVSKKELTDFLIEALIGKKIKIYKFKNENGF